MTYQELKYRCQRIIGLSPGSSETPLECMRLMSNLSRGSRAIAAEMLARELAEYVEQLPKSGSK